MRLLLRFVLVIFVLAIVGIGAMLFIPGEKIARFAEDQFENATGRALQISGDVRTSIYPLLGVRTGPVTIANAPWSDGGPMVQAEGLSIGVDLAALFGGEVKIKKVEVIAPKILLEVAKDGQANWEMVPPGGAPEAAGGPSGSGGIPPFSLGKGMIRGGRLTYIDHASGEKYVLTELDGDLHLPEFEAQGEVVFSARMNGQPLKLSANVAHFGKFLNGGISGMAVKFQAGGSTIALDGKGGLSPRAVEGSLDADLADMPALFALLGMQAPDLPKGMGRRARITGQVTYTPKGSAHLRGGRIALDQNILTGAADLFVTGRERPLVKAQLEADKLDFSVLAASVDNETGQEVGTSSAGWPKDVIETDWLSAVDAEVGLAANAVDLGTIKLGQTLVGAKLDRSRVVFTLHNIQAYQGKVSGEFVMNGRGGLSVGGKLQASGIAAQPLLVDLADYDRLITTADMQVKFLGVGNTLDAIMNSLSGNGSFRLGKGEILGLDLVGMLRNLDASYRGKGQKTVFKSVSASFEMKDGVLQNDDLLFESPLVQAKGTGKVGIGAQTLDYRITPVALASEDGSGGISVPVLITGTWADPKFRPDLQALIDQNLAEEKAALEAKIAAEKAAAQARLAAEKEALRAKLEAERAAAEQRAQEALGVDQQDGETLEDAARRKLEEEAKRGLQNLLGGNN
ncbi:MAG TPA: AsmA family protein [Rhodobacteraceae bacterium]|nr:AsmA family protein [Paracoccaceae bacterium]